MILLLSVQFSCLEFSKGTPIIIRWGKPDGMWGKQMRIIFHFCIFCFGSFSGGKIIKPFVQYKTFKAFCVIGLALKYLAGIGIKCNKQTHPHGGYWVVLMIKKWLGPTFLLKGVFSLKVTICFDNRGREGSYYFYLIIHFVLCFLLQTPHLKPHALSLQFGEMTGPTRKHKHNP